MAVALASSVLPWCCSIVSRSTLALRPSCSFVRTDCGNRAGDGGWLKAGGFNAGSAFVTTSSIYRGCCKQHPRYIEDAVTTVRTANEQQIRVSDCDNHAGIKKMNHPLCMGYRMCLHGCYMCNHQSHTQLPWDTTIAHTRGVQSGNLAIQSGDLALPGEGVVRISGLRQLWGGGAHEWVPV